MSRGKTIRDHGDKTFINKYKKNEEHKHINTYVLDFHLPEL